MKRISLTKKKTPLIVSVVGTSGSGKTTTIEHLIASLTKLGFRVGVAKHIHREGFTIDTEGKDTWKHARAGAKVIIGASPNELAIIKKMSFETKFEEITEILRRQELDVALLEGFSTALSKRIMVHKIVAAKSARDLKYTLSKTRPPILAITGQVTRTKKAIPNAPASLVDIEREGPLLTSRIRRLLRPKELAHLLHKASIRHGGACIGLAIGVRAAYVATSALGENPTAPTSIVCGTKQCIAEAFKMAYPKSDVRIDKVRNDKITVKASGANLVIQLAPKEEYSGAKEALKASDRKLFQSVSFAKQ